MAVFDRHFYGVAATLQVEITMQRPSTMPARDKKTGQFKPGKKSQAAPKTSAALMESMGAKRGSKKK